MGTASSGFGNSKKPVKLKVSNINTFLDRYDTLLLDCDGVLWRKDQLRDIPGVSDSLQKLCLLGKRLIFVSNNSLYSRKNYRQKIKERTGYLAPVNDIFAIDYAIAIYLTEILDLKGSSVYVIGRQALAEELRDTGLIPIGVGPDPDPVPMKPQDLLKIAVPPVKAVVVGFDSHFCYNKLFKAACALTNNTTCHFVASTQERRVRMTKSRLAPVDGTFALSIQAASGKDPVYIGKPNKYLFDCIERVHPNIDKKRTCMVGDTVETDVAFAKNVGIDSLLVLTGSVDDKIKLKRTNFTNENGSRSEATPNYIMESFGDLGRWL